MALDHMGLDSQRKFGTSRLGMSLGESRVTDMNERAVKNDLLETKKVQRLGRRAYRAALRGQDSSAYLKGLDALEAMKAVNGTTGAGIKMAGADQAGLEKHIGNTRSQIESFNGKSLDGNGGLVPRGGSRILGNGSGNTPANAKASSNGGEWVNVSGSATPERGRTMEFRNWSGVKDGKVGDLQSGDGAEQATSPAGGPLTSRMGGYRPGLSSAIGALQAKWMNEERANDLARQQAAYEAANGTPAQQAVANMPPATTVRVDGLVDKYASRFPGIEKLKGLSDADKADAVQQGKDALLPYEIASPGGFTPEDKRGLRRVVGLFGGAPGDESQIRGEMAVGDFAKRVANTSLQDAASAIQGGAGTIASRLLSGFDAARGLLGRSIEAAPSTSSTPASILLSKPSAAPLAVSGGFYDTNQTTANPSSAWGQAPSRLQAHKFNPDATIPAVAGRLWKEMNRKPKGPNRGQYSFNR